MTLNDVLKGIPKEDYGKCLIYNDGIGWTNIWFKNQESQITLIADDNRIFSEDK